MLFDMLLLILEHIDDDRKDIKSIETMLAA